MIWFFMFMSFISDFLGSDNSLNSFNDDFGDTFDDDWEDLDDNFTADDSSDEDTQSVSSNCSIPLSCIALYNYEVYMQLTLFLTFLRNTLFLAGFTN